MSQDTFFSSLGGRGFGPGTPLLANSARPLRENFMQIGLATSEEIRDWAERSYLLQGKYVEIGEVKKADTINYRTFKPEKDGLFCERIFGPVNDWVCGCGNEVRGGAQGNSGKSLWGPSATKTVRPKGGTVNSTIPSICPNCQVEFTLSRIRRYRMGYINLACKVTHIWYLNSRPNLFSVLLKMPTKYVKKITYYKGYTPSDPKLWNPCLGPGGDFFDTEWEFIHRWLGGGGASAAWGGPPPSAAGTKFFDEVQKGGVPPAPPAWLENTGADALQNYLATRDWEKDVKQLEDELRRTPNLVASSEGGRIDFRLAVPFLLKRRKKRVRTLKLLNIFRAAGGANCFRSSGLILNKIPVLPPELRPIVQLNAGQLASSDVNDLYRRVISRNNRLKYYLTGAGGRTTSAASPPVEFLVRSERHLVQLACDALLENGKTTNVRHSVGARSGGSGRRGSTPLGPPYKSLSDRIGGKQGRFRQNLLGKRVDYSGRSVIVVGPKLKLYECGLPYEMAKELFQAFLIRHIMELQLAKTIRGAKNLIRFNEPLIRQLLENVVFAHPILLNRAPTLHRLGIQAFQPKLVNGRGIQLHPLVCPAFNADFDGDQMAVHVPLSPSSRIEARLLMLANTNWLSPATGQPSILPSQDMVLGFYYLSIEATSGRAKTSEDKTSKRLSYVNFADVLQSYEAPESALNLHSPVWVLRPDQYQPTCGPLNTGAAPHRKKGSNFHGTPLLASGPSGPSATTSAFGRQGKSPDEPLHVRVSRFGTVRKLYTSFKWLEDSQERRRDFAIRTTPGRILVNQILQDFSSGPKGGVSPLT
jgi:DNA-directed RNA polymerase subunit beta'